MGKSLEEKKELTLQYYKLSYSLDTALLMADVSKAEQSLLKNDEEFLYRIQYEDATIRQTLFTTLLNGVTSSDEKHARNCALDLAKILDSDRFNGKVEKVKTIVPDSINLVGKKA